MRWEDEKYVRLYTRDTVDWLGLSFIAQGLFCLILRKVDRAGILELGKHGRRAVAIAVGFPGEWSRLDPALEELVADGCVRLDGGHLVIPNFIEAQEAVQSDAARKRAQRERARARVTGVPERDENGPASPDTRDVSSQTGTHGHDTGRVVPLSHARSRAVTRGHSSLAEPSEPSVEAASLLAGARVGAEPETLVPVAVEAAPPPEADTAAGTTQQPDTSDPEPGQGEGPTRPVTPASGRGVRSEASGVDSPRPSAAAGTDSQHNPQRRDEKPQGPTTIASATLGPRDGIAAAMAAPLTPGYTPPGFRPYEPVDDGPDDGLPPARPMPAAPAPKSAPANRGPIVDDLRGPPPLLVDSTEIPEPAASVRAELERQIGRKLALAGKDDFAVQVARLEAVREGEALRVCVESAAQYRQRTGGELPGSLAWFAEAMAKFLGEPLLGKPPPLPAPDPTWLASLPADLRVKAEAQYQLARERLMKAAWPDRLVGLLDQEIAGLVTRIDGMRLASPGGAP